MQSSVHFAMLTDPGRIRSSNQDACAADHEAGVYVVCDGMGGAAGGEVASRMAADVFLDVYEANPQASLSEAIHAVNAAVYRRSREDFALNGMGTTLVAMLLDPAEAPQDVRIAHVGDSRAYLWRGGQLHALTEDHSLVEEQFRAGQISRAEADRAPYRNIITRAIGSFAQVEPELTSCRLEDGDLFLLATDGLNRELEDEAIAELLRQHGGAGLPDICQALINAANDAGGRDNITVLLLRIG
jgi:protein phosphatase